MKRVLFLDDNPARRRWFGLHGVSFEDQLWFAIDAEGAIKCLSDPIHADGFDLVYLDHDLGEETFVDSDRKDCGMEVVRWIVANKPKIGEIVVHTMNTPAGHGMVRALREAGYSACYRSFFRMVHGEPVNYDVPEELI